MFFLVNLLVVLAITCAANFSILFIKETLGTGMAAIGHILSWTAAVSAVAFFPAGWLCDRVSPMTVSLWSIILLTVGALIAYFTVNDQNGYLIYSLLYAVPLAGWTLGAAATAMKLFPPEKFGQFSGGMNVFACGGLLVGNFAIGLLVDLVHGNYRIAFLWTVVLSAMAIVPMVMVIRGWKQLGGPDNYIAPLPR